jgi:Undecaprenyl-phosphate glucose phosphotransferase
MLNNRNKLQFFRQTVDYIVLVLSFVFALFLTYQKLHFELSSFDVFFLLLLILLWFFVSKSFGVYDEFRSRNFVHEFIAVLKSIIVYTIVMIIILFMVRSQAHSRYFVAVNSLSLLTLLIFSKIIVRQSIVSLRVKGRNLRYLLIIGSGGIGRTFGRMVSKNMSFGYSIIGFLDDHKAFLKDEEYLGRIEDLDKILMERQIDDVIVALPSQSIEKLEQIVNTCSAYTTRVRIIPDYFKFLSKKYSISTFGNLPIISVNEIKLDQIQWRLFKRIMDYGFTIFLFIFLFSWLWPVIAIIIKINSKGPVFFKQTRHGRDNRPFKTYKFRSMRTDCDDIDSSGKFQQAKKNDPRITKIGAFLRKTNLDELPQFINVLKGEMSIVGPRPHPVKLNEESREHVTAYMQRHFVKPGISGWAQVNGFRGETSEEGLMQKRIDHDIWYMENWSFFLDTQIILMTVWNMIKGDPKAY